MDYLELGKYLAKQAGEIMLQNFELGVKVDYKSDDSPVTQADIKINKLVIDTIGKVFPEHSVQGEEQSNIKVGAEYLWSCDPIDGTRPYSLGIPTNAFSLALVKDGYPILGITYDPHQKRMLYAEQGKGAFLETQGKITRTSVNSKATLRKMGIGFGSKESPMFGFEFGEAVMAEGAKIFLLHSVVYEAAMVAMGQFGAIVWGGETAHDIAATKIIIEEAGGKATDLWGQEQRYDQPVSGALFSNGFLHETLLEMLRPHLVERKTDTFV